MQSNRFFIHLVWQSIQREDQLRNDLRLEREKNLKVEREKMDILKKLAERLQDPEREVARETQVAKETQS